jgi:hypothetical protein
MNDHVARMLRDAEERLHDADILAGAPSGGSSSSLLRILALEVLLKAVQYATLGAYQPHHRYVELWSALPSEARAQILAVAGDRFPGHACFNDLDALLKDWEFAFMKGRYYFELYEHQSAAEQRKTVEAWLARGAPLDEAQVSYHPLELQALAYGLIGYLERG